MKRLNDNLLQAVGKALENATPATRTNVIQKLNAEIVVGRNWGGYFNLRVTADADSLADREITHLKFTPLTDEGVVVIEVADPDDEGAVEFKRSPTLHTGNVHMRAALADFDLAFAEKRNMIFPVEVATVPVSGGERKVMIMRVKKHSTKKSVPRPRKNSPGGTAGTTGTSARGSRTATSTSASAATPAAGPAPTPSGTPSVPVAASAQTDEKKE